MKVLYFAYGSNMNNAQMADRCPRAENLGPAVLEGWELRERLHADIEPCKDEKVYGVLWGVTKDCIKSLDHYEGFPSYYIKKTVSVRMKGCHATVKAIVYIMNNNTIRYCRDTEPFSPSYAKACGKGAEENGVPVHPLYKLGMSFPSEFHIE